VNFYSNPKKLNNFFVKKMSFVYCAVLKFPGTVLCEFQRDGATTACKTARSKSKEVFKEQQEIPLENDCIMYSLKNASDNDAQFICVCTQGEAYEDKAFTLLSKVRRDFLDEFFGGKATGFKEKKMSSMCYQQDFCKQIELAMKNLDTGIKLGTVRIAQQKVDETAAVMQNALRKQMDMNMNTVDLYEQSADIKKSSKQFLLEGNRFEQQIKKSSFWWCSRNCILMFLIPIIIMILYVCGSFVYCGDLTAAVGCRYGPKQI